ncbi:MAG: S41 family peptidase [Thermoanaerobaculia bacterium]
MKSNRSRLAFVLASVAALLLLTALKGPILAPGKDPVLKPLAIFTEVLNLTRSNYVEPVDTSVLLAGAYDGVTDAIDPYSYYVSADQMEKYRAFAASKASGSGLVLGRRGGFAFVVAPVPGSPAEAAGVKPGDVILSVDGVPSRNQSLWQIEARLSGPEGTAASLRLLRGGDEREVTVRVVRKAFRPEARVTRRLEQQVPVIRIPYFQPGVAEAVRRELESVPAGTPAVVVDVRDSAGGDVDEAVRTASLFIPQGEVAKISGKKIPPKTLSTAGAQVWKGRTVVLIDNGSGGPPEVFAGALHDRAASDLVGEPTAGMAIVQRLLPMSSGGALFMTVGEYVTPGGTELTGKALRPTIRVDLFPGEKSDGDPVVRRAVEVARGAVAKSAAS